MEDSSDLREQFTRVLEASKLGFIIETIPSSVGLNRRLTSRKYDALVVDYDLSVGDPGAILKSTKEIDPFLPAIIVSRDFTEGIYMETQQMGADWYVPMTPVSMKMFPHILLERIEGIGFVREAIEARHQSTLKSYQIEILASLVRKMVETHDLKSVMQEMAEQVVKKLDMKVVSLQRFFPRQNGFAVYGMYPQGKLVKFAQMFFGISLDTFVFPFDPAHCIVDQYTLERKAWIGNDFVDVFGTTMPAQASRMIQKFAGVRSIYNAPFYSKDQLLGGIIVGNVRKSFTDEELEAFDAIVHISSLLFEYNEAAKAQIVQNHKLQAIHEISSQLHENLDPGKIFDIIQAKLNTIVPADVVRLFVYNASSNSLVERKSITKKGRIPGFMVPEIPVGSGLIGLAASDRRSVLENNAHNNPLSVYATGRPDLEHLLAVPIIHHGELLGMIAMTRLTDEPFSETDREALEIFTSQFGIAFHNSRLYEDLQRSESLYRLVLENVNDPVIFVGTDGSLRFVNPKFEELTGYTAVEVLGKKFDFLIHPDDLTMAKRYYLSRIGAKSAPGRYEIRFVKKSGEVRVVDYNVTAISENGRLTGVLAVARDVTDDIAARNNLELKTKQLQQLLDINMLLMHSSNFAELLDKLIAAARGAVPQADAGVVLIHDRASARLSPAATIGYPKELREALNLDPDESWIKKVFRGGTSIIIEDSDSYPLPKAIANFPPNYRMKSCVAAPLMIENEVLGVISLESFTRSRAFGDEQLQLLETIAHQAALGLKKEQMHGEMKESESRYRTITESSSDLIVMVDDRGKIDFCNDRFFQTFGVKADFARGKMIADFFEPASRQVISEIVKTDSPDKKYRVTARIEGVQRHFDVAARRIKIELGVHRQILFLNDVSDIVRTGDWMERAYEVGLKRSGVEMLESYTDLLADVFNTELVYIGECDTDSDSSIAQAARVGDRYLHTLAFKGVSDLLSNDPEKVACVDRIFKSEKGWRSYYATQIEVNDKCVGLIVLASERVLNSGRAQMSILKLVKQRLAFEYERQVNEAETRRLEEQLRQSQKMESLGTLAGGVAHDFNNILGAILGYAGLLRLELKNNEKLTKYIETIERSARRASELTKQLLGFARGGKTSVMSVDFNRICRETVELTKKMIEKNVVVSLDLYPDLPAVEGDESQLSQVMMNLAINARDAIPNGGSLRISTSVVKANRAPGYNPNLEKREYVVVEVADSGHGISKGNLVRIFEPFFTTKPKGKGTGLGLSMVYGIIKNHGGEIDVNSQVNKGTTFRIYLPVSSQKISSRTPKRDGEVEKLVSDKTCLVVDDESEFREMLSDSLARFGFTVVSAESGEKALEILRRGRTIDLVVLDMIMPGIDGRETYFELKKIRPGLPVFVSTGYSSEGKVQDIMDNGGLGVLHKPFALGELKLQLVDRYRELAPGTSEEGK